MSETCSCKKDGWICPRCLKSNAPFMDHCDCLPNYIPFVPYYPLYPSYPQWPYRPWDGTIVVTCEGNSCTYKVESATSK